VNYPKPQLLIGGKWRSGEGRATQPVINPATEQSLGDLPLATAADLDEALAAAETAFPVWRAVSPVERGKILRKAASLLRERGEEIARIATMEMGKPIRQTRIEVEMSAGVLEWYAEEGRRAYGRVIPGYPGMRLTVRKEPIGPVGAVAPWNFPLGNPARKLGAALGAGCSVILKPAEESPVSATEFARCLIDAGLPEGVMSIVFGVPQQVAEHIIGSPIIRKVSFTGSIPVGKELMKLAANNVTRTTMELGGHGPVLVFDDVDVDAVLDQAVAAKFRNSGQVCVSPTRFFVQEKIYDRFVDGFVQRAGRLNVGDGLDEATDMGPLAHSRRIAAMESLMADSKASGATVRMGGARSNRSGFFFEPTVLTDLPDDARAMNEEPFGPVALMRPFGAYEEAIHQANRLEYGLAAYAWTNNAKRTTALGNDIEAGMVGINTFRISVHEAPFGGVKQSGHGSEEGPEGLDACLVTKFVAEA
jgi:succinate-semialdehyde dehydrogenase/glutarate-semialdehyde dehydrogenase